VGKRLFACPPILPVPRGANDKAVYESIVNQETNGASVIDFVISWCIGFAKAKQ